MKKLLALLTAAVATLTSAWAATPVAVWDGFTSADGDLTKGDYSWDKSTNTTAEDGKLVIGSDGGLTMTTPTSSNIFTDRKITIVMDVEDIPDGDVTIYGFLNVQSNNAQNRVSLDSNNGSIYQHWNRGGNYGNATFDRSAKHRIAYAYQGAANVGSTTYVDGTQAMEKNGLQASSGNITTLFVGNYYTGGATNNIASGMKISKIALFDSKLSVADVASYKFPSEVSSHTANDVSGEVNWSNIAFEPAWVSGDTKQAIVNLTGDATITVPADFQANSIAFSGAHNVTIKGSTNLNVATITVDGATIVERPITVAEATSTISVPANTTYVTHGDITANAAVAATGTLVIADGSATIGGAQQALKGALTVAKGASFVSSQYDWPTYTENESCEINVYGTLDLAGQRWTAFSTCAINLYEGGLIKTDSAISAINGGASIDLFENSVVNVKASDGDTTNTATITAVIGTHNSNVALNVEEGIKLVLASAASVPMDLNRRSGFTKSGAGTLKISGDISTQNTLIVAEDSGAVTFVDGAKAPKAISGAYTISGAVEFPSTTAATGASIAADGVAVIDVTSAQLTSGTSVEVAAIAEGGAVQFKDPSGNIFEGSIDGTTAALAAFSYTFTGEGDWSNADNWAAGLIPANGAAVIEGAVTLTEDLAFNGGLTGTGSITIPDAMTLTVPNTINVAVKGDGTLAFSDAILPAGTVLHDALKATDWTGTCVLKDVTGIGDFDPNNFGNDGSTLRLIGCSGYFKSASFSINPTVDLVNSTTANKTYGLKVTNGYGSQVITFGKVTGSGTLLASKPGGAPKTRLVCQDIAGFTGTFEVETNGNCSGIVLGSGYTHSDQDNGKIVVLNGTTIPAGVTLKNPIGGIKIPEGAVVTNKGTINGQMNGAGEVQYFGPEDGLFTSAMFSAISETAGYTNTAWTGTVTLKNWGKLDERNTNNRNHARDCLPGNDVLSKLQNTNSKIKFKGVIAYIPSGANYDFNLVLEDNEEAYLEKTCAWFNDTGSSTGSPTTFAKISGTGTFLDTHTACTHRINFVDVSDFEGTIKVGSKRIAIGSASSVTYGDGGTIKILEGAEAEIAEGKTWTAAHGIIVDGTLKTHAALATLPTTSLADHKIVAPEAVDGVYTYAPSAVTYATLTIETVENCTITVKNSETVVETGAKFDVDNATELTVTRTPAEGYHLADGYAAEETVTMTENRTITAAVEEDTPEPEYPEEIETSDEDVKSAFDAWVKEHNVTNPSSANVNAFILGLAPEATTEAIQQAVEDEVPEIDMAELVGGDLEAAVAAIQDKYPNATVTLKDVTSEVSGATSDNTHLYTLVIELKK